ncbi:MAG: Gp15 family bacteriophage protein, partial [Oscillospiraceae bacterium]
MNPPVAILPKSLCICGKDREINTDYRIALWIFKALEDSELNKKEKIIVMLDNLYKDDIYRFNADELKEACEKAQW